MLYLTYPNAKKLFHLTPPFLSILILSSPKRSLCSSSFFPIRVHMVNNFYMYMEKTALCGIVVLSGWFLLILLPFLSYLKMKCWVEFPLGPGKQWFSSCLFRPSCGVTLPTVGGVHGTREAWLLKAQPLHFQIMSQAPATQEFLPQLSWFCF